MGFPVSEHEARPDWGALVERLASASLLVLGDVILDTYIRGSVTRISPEAPVPVVAVTGEEFRLGGAANVAANLASLGTRCELIGVVGEDEAAGDLTTQLSEAGIDATGLVRDISRQTSVKSRIVAQNQQIVRLDRESVHPLARRVRSEVADRVLGRVDSVDAVIVADYEKGLLDEALIRKVRDAAHAQDIPLLVDPKPEHFTWYRGATGMTPNVAEASAVVGRRIRADEDVGAAGAQLMSGLELQFLLITRGSQGLSLFEREDGGLRVAHIPTVAREVYDVTGAGDTVVAVLGAAIAAGASHTAAARIANYAAGIVVGRLGCATVTRPELWEVMDASVEEDSAHIRTEQITAT